MDDYSKFLIKDYKYWAVYIHQNQGYLGRPRYAKPRKFMGITFKDKLYGHNYKTDHSFKTSRNVLLAIQNKIKKALK